MESEPLENGVKITSTARILVKGTMNLKEQKSEDRIKLWNTWRE